MSVAVDPTRLVDL